MPSSRETRPLSLHDALPISSDVVGGLALAFGALSVAEAAIDSIDRRHRRPPDRSRGREADLGEDPVAVASGRMDLDLVAHAGLDRKSTRLNSSHLGISYAVVTRDASFVPTRRSSDLVGRGGRPRPRLRGAVGRRGGDRQHRPSPSTTAGPVTWP